MLLNRLLSVDFPGRAELVRQAEAVRVTNTGGATPTLVFAVAADAVPASVVRRVPVEAIATDSDGMRIHLLLHVVSGLLAEIEAFREDGNPIRSYPAANELHQLDAG